MRTSKYAILTIILTTLLTTTGQYLLKMGATQINSFYSIFNIPLILSLFIYVISAVLLVVSLKFGDLSVLYPFVSLSFVWVFLVSQFVLGESVLFLNWLGLVMIMFGVSFIGWGAKE